MTPEKQAKLAKIAYMNTKVQAVTIAVVNAKIDALASALGITFNANGTLQSNGYSSHTHAYTDATIADTADGTGTTSQANKNTQGVN